MVRRRNVGVAIVSATLLAVAACGGGEDTGTQQGEQVFTKTPGGALQAWGFDNADDVGKARLDHAKQQLSGVTITLDQTGFDAQKFTTRLASGQVPDVVQMDRQFVATYAAQDLIQPLDACFAAWGVDPRTHYYPSVTADVTYQDKVWAVPQFFQPAAIIVNRRVLDEAGVAPEAIDPSQGDALIATAEKLYRASGGNPSRMGFDPVATGQPALWLLSFGGRLVDEAGKPTLDDPNNVKAVAYLKRMIDAQGGWAKVKSFTDSFDVFGKGNQYVKDQVAAQVNAQWYVNVLTPYVKEVEIGGVPFRDQTGQPFAVAGGSSFVIPAKAKNPDAACAWMIALTSQEGWMAAGKARADTVAKRPGGIYTGLFTGSPVADEQIRSTFVKPSGNEGFDQTIATFYDVVSKGKSVGASPAGQAIQSELQNAIASSLLGSKTPEQALADAQTAAQRAYDQIAG